MGNLYILDKPFGENGLSLAMGDSSAVVVLIQDGVYLNCSGLRAAGIEIHAIRRDVESRGQGGRLSDVHVIDYGQLVDLVVANKVINFA
jgi:sulfur relay protein TusB/DsrH